MTRHDIQGRCCTEASCISSKFVENRNHVIRATAKGWGIDNIVVHSYPHKTILSLDLIGNLELKIMKYSLTTDESKNIMISSNEKRRRAPKAVLKTYMVLIKWNRIPRTNERTKNETRSQYIYVLKSGGGIIMTLAKM